MYFVGYFCNQKSLTCLSLIFFTMVFKFTSDHVEALIIGLDVLSLLPASNSNDKVFSKDRTTTLSQRFGGQYA